MIIDFHTHCFPDGLAMKAVESLSEKAGIPAMLNGTSSDLKRSMEANGIAGSVLFNIATKPSQTENINNWSVQIRDESVIPFGSIHPLSEDWESELKRIKELGLRGIKFHPEYQEFYVDDESMFPIYELAFELGLVIAFHAGVDLGFDPPYHCTPDRLATLLERFKGGKIVAAHMGGYKYWDEVETHLAGKDIYFDTSYAVGIMDSEQAKRIIYDHGYSKILFGSDSPWKDQGWSVQCIKDLCLGPEIEEAIFYKNAVELLGL
ncbi:MAG TPA: TatD family hydrolase [Clostridiales bacterium]|nr:TatD family hydrolase [Bacillota bacterium]HOA55582.1 TatD family hydrolase [Clostridiales bacterium]HOL92321.1 TatD family hydrolase [Clostridiales bacterium]HPP36443.1 TatD family hydrolase [Clostridiales bacterium]